MMGMASRVTTRPGHENASALTRPQAPRGGHNDVGSKRKKQETTNFAGDAFRILGKAMTVFQLHRKPPDENASGGKLDEAVYPERGEADAMGNDACTDGDGALNRHPCDSEPFQTERLRDKWCARGVWRGRCRYSSAVAAAAYRSASQFTDQRQGQSFDYSDKSAVMSAKHSATWASDRQRLSVIGNKQGIEPSPHPTSSTRMLGSKSAKSKRCINLGRSSAPMVSSVGNNHAAPRLKCSQPRRRG
jgi:hypothetical protein